MRSSLKEELSTRIPPTNPVFDSGAPQADQSTNSFGGFIYAESERVECEGVHYIDGNFWELFQKKKRLGEGTSGLVRRCIRKSDGKEFAVKIVRTRDEEISSQLIEEFRNISKLQHKNIVQVFELYIDVHRAKIYSIQELISGGEMFQYIVNCGSYTGTSFYWPRKFG